MTDPYLITITLDLILIVYRDWNSLVSSVLGLLSCMMQLRGLEPPLSLV